MLCTFGVHSKCALICSTDKEITTYFYLSSLSGYVAVINVHFNTDKFRLYPDKAGLMIKYISMVEIQL